MTDYASAEFWQGAPEGATHYTPKLDDSGIWCAVFWMLVDGAPVEAWRVEDSGELTHISDPSHTEENKARMIPRPTPQWSGEGLPPVGTRLECQYAVEGFTTWHAGECIGVGFSPEGEAMCVVKAGETISCYRAGSRMRPIRTPSQIAAELRTATIKRAAELCPFPRADSTLVVLEALYDNGILKGDAK